MEQKMILVTLKNEVTPRERRRRAKERRMVRKAFAIALLITAAIALSGLGLHKALAEEESTLPCNNVELEIEQDMAASMAELLSSSQDSLPEQNPPVEPEPVSRYPAITEDERELLARMVYLEARGESAEGQQAVVEVTMNRVVAQNFPDTVQEVLYQKGQYATAPYLETAEPTEAQYKAVDAAIFGEPVLPMDVVFFSVGGENDNVWGTIGGHTFCYQY